MNFEINDNFRVQDERITFSAIVNEGAVEYSFTIPTVEHYFGVDSVDDCLSALKANVSLIAEVAECYARLNPGLSKNIITFRDLDEIRLSILPEKYRNL
ncbi:hypothetical protein [Pseudohongiella sp. O18]|uniref:hypothetical protein n=1 Tax=Pseudohongiella sp. O18 TaxID=2904248 RepID=UPI001F1DCD30|nr:hypothetical protein [Pseudohongiella sp. O18]